MAWAARTPAGFTFNIKAFSLFTQHPTPVGRCPADLRPAAEQTGKDRVYLKDVDPAVADQVWERFLAALDPLRERERKLGAILLQFPPWFPIGRARKEYIVACAQRAAPDRVCVEFRNRTWMTPDNQEETLGFLAAAPAAVCVRGHAAGPPRLHPAGAGRHRARSGRGPPARALGQVGQQGHPRAVRLPLQRRPSWTNGQPRVAASGRPTPTTTHVLFNNCYRDYAQVNAQQLAALLKPDHRLRESNDQNLWMVLGGVT